MYNATEPRHALVDVASDGDATAGGREAGFAHARLARVRSVRTDVPRRALRQPRGEVPAGQRMAVEGRGGPRPGGVGTTVAMETITLAVERIERALGSAPPPPTSRSPVQRGTAFLPVLRGSPQPFVPRPPPP